MCEMVATKKEEQITSVIGLCTVRNLGFKRSKLKYCLQINPFVRKFLGRKRPLKILPTKNLFLGINLDSMMSKIDADCLGIH